VDKFELRVRLVWLAVQLFGAGWLCWMLYHTVLERWNRELATISLVIFVLLLALGVVMGLAMREEERDKC